MTDDFMSRQAEIKAKRKTVRDRSGQFTPAYVAKELQDARIARTQALKAELGWEDETVEKAPSVVTVEDLSVRPLVIPPGRKLIRAYTRRDHAPKFDQPSFFEGATA